MGMEDPTVTKNDVCEADASTERLCRPKYEVFHGVESTGCDILPAKLRPVRQELFEDDLFDTCNHDDDDDDDENIIVSMSKLSYLVKYVGMHRTDDDKCSFPNMQLVIDDRKGLCVFVKVVCHTCKFSTEPLALSREIKVDGKRGPPESLLNASLSLPALKSKMGPTDIALLLACLNIKPPARSGMYKKFNSAADKIVTVNEKSMVQNQQFVSEVNALSNRERTVDVQSDTCFNNRPRAGMEAGTQSFSPLIEQNTQKKLVIALCSSNKLCRIKNCEHSACKQNCHATETIASSEAKHLVTNLSKVNGGGHIEVTAITTDASAQIAKTIRDFQARNNCTITHYHCLVHKMRTIQKHIKNLKLKINLPGADRPYYMQKLAASVRNRVHIELSRIHTLLRHSPHRFVHTAKQAVDNIISCFSGDHRQCRNTSQVCCAHLPIYTTKHLPYGRHLNLQTQDITLLNAAIAKHLGVDTLAKLSMVYTTNKAESTHNRVFTYAPKNSTWARNFHGLCHSAVHSSTFGTGRSLLLLAKAIGVSFARSGPAIKYMILKDRKSQYDKQRQESRQYKGTRYFSKKLRGNRKMRVGSMYTHCDPAQNDEHAYGINLN
jgi:hypothetical protein